MPYKSDKQRKFMHARHPGIAAKWDSEIRSKRVKKNSSKSGWLKPLLVGTGAGVLANQAPPIQETVKEHRRKKKGQVKKAYTPVSSDPDFNHQAAERAFNLVMKMDEPTARMFTTIVVSDLFEDDINNNLATIQKALNVVFAERAEVVKKALVRAALHSPPDQLETFGKAFGFLEEISKAPHTPQFYGYDWDPSDFRRDPGSGRFVVKVKHTQTHPLTGQQELAVVGREAPAHLNRAQKAQFQDEYRQVASFLSGVTGVGGGQPGDTDVIYHFQDKAGNNFTSVKPDLDSIVPVLEDPNTKLVAMEARPKTLTAGGAAYGLMGGMNEEQVARTNRVLGPDLNTSVAGQAVTDWTNAGDPMASNRKLFDRLSASGKFLNQAAPPGSKAQVAGKFADVVGQYGPEAEKVIGPTARKTAYRYRGTEKTPDADLVTVYGREIMDAKKYGMSDAEADKRMMGFGTRREQARGDFTSFQTRRGTGSNRGEAEREAPVPSFNQGGRFAAYQDELANREPSWTERKAGSAIVTDFLRRKLPDKHLYKLHVQAGNTPPSEGVIINDQGQIASQAVGYGDDHYLPFNLKHLDALKGGEYIRSRSVGGLTSEDIYTGLISGARRVTVVSRSGTFTMEFEPDFRGGRRHNDKAKRMTGRYEQLLDAVQSGQVDRQPIPKRWKDAIKEEVQTDEYYATAPKAVQQDEIEARLKEFKENPKIEGRDEDRAEHMAQQVETQAARGEISEQDAKDYRAQVFNDLYNMKEVRFRLNGIGYEAALKGLQEQFPYYIKEAKSKPTRDEELLEFTLDDGYVEPGRNRPTRVNAGYFGTEQNPENRTGFISASRTNYQRGQKQKAGTEPLRRGFSQETTPAEPAEATDALTGSTTTGNVSEEQQRKQRIQDRLAKEGARSEATQRAVKIRQDIKMGVGDDNFVGSGEKPEFMSMDDNRFEEWLNEKPENEEAFHKFLETNSERWSRQPDEGEGGIGGFKDRWEKYSQARLKLKPNPYSRDKAGHLPSVPYTFLDHKEAAYHAGARPHEITGELNKLNKDMYMATTRKRVGDMNDAEMKAEITRVGTLWDMIKDDGATVDEALAANRSQNVEAVDDGRLKSVFKDADSVAEHLEKIHQARYLQSMEKVAHKPPTPRPAAGKGGTSGGGSTGGTSKPKPKPDGGGSKPEAGGKLVKVPNDIAEIKVPIEDDPDALRAGVANARAELMKATGPDSNLSPGDQGKALKIADRVDDLQAYMGAGLGNNAIRDEYLKLPPEVQKWITGEHKSFVAQASP